MFRNCVGLELISQEDFFSATFPMRYTWDSTTHTRHVKFLDVVSEVIAACKMYNVPCSSKWCEFVGFDSYSSCDCCWWTVQSIVNMDPHSVGSYLETSEGRLILDNEATIAATLQNITALVHAANGHQAAYFFDMALQVRGCWSVRIQEHIIYWIHWLVCNYDSWQSLRWVWWCYNSLLSFSQLCTRLATSSCVEIEAV